MYRVWESKQAKLRPLVQADYPVVFQWCSDPSTAIRWRFRGAVPDFQDFLKLMVGGVLVQFVLQRKGSDRAVGLVTAYNANNRAGYAYVAALAAPDHRGVGDTMEGIRLLIQYLFITWPFRKLYFEILEFNLPQFEHYSAVFTEEGRFREHAYYDGRYWYLVTLSIFRHQWEASGIGLSTSALRVSRGGGCNWQAVGLDPQRVLSPCRR